MKIFISESSTYKKGDRIIVNAGTARKPEYWVVTVTSVGRGKWNVQYDDGDKGAVDDPRDIVSRANKKRSRVSFGKDGLPKFQLKEKAAKKKAPAKKATKKVATKKKAPAKKVAKKKSAPKKSSTKSKVSNHVSDLIGDDFKQTHSDMRENTFEMKLHEGAEEADRLGKSLEANGWIKSGGVAAGRKYFKGDSKIDIQDDKLILKEPVDKTDAPKKVPTKKAAKKKRGAIEVADVATREDAHKHVSGLLKTMGARGKKVSDYRVELPKNTKLRPENLESMLHKAGWEKTKDGKLSTDYQDGNPSEFTNGKIKIKISHGRTNSYGYNWDRSIHIQ